MKLIIAGGGTGGHIFPAIAVADTFSSRETKKNILFIGTKHGIEQTVVPKRDYSIHFIKVRGIKRTGLLNTFFGMLEIPMAVISSILAIIRFRPDFVLGTGGYCSGPTLIAAILSGKKTAIMEQNSVPGITNRILSRMVNLIFISYKYNTNYFPAGKCVLSGNPVSKSFVENIRKFSREKPGPLTPILTILGGSQGSHIINKIVTAAIQLIKQPPENLTIIHQTGKIDYKDIKKTYEKISFSSTVKPFFENMSEIYAQSDLIVCRAGAMTISEIAIAGKPSILIPFAGAADNHQETNARELVSAGAAYIITEKELTPEKLAKKISDLLLNSEKLRLMGRQARKLATPHAATIIVEGIRKLCSNGDLK